MVLIIVGIVGFIGYYSSHAKNNTKPPTSPSIGSVNSAKNKPSNNGVIKVTSAEGKVVQSQDKSYSLTIPQNWFYKFENSSNLSHIATTPNEKLLKSYPIEFYALPNQCITKPPTASPESQSFITKAVLLNGTNGYRSEDTDNGASTSPNMKHIYYQLCKTGTGYYANYAIKSGDPEFIAEFDALVQTWKFELR